MKRYFILTLLLICGLYSLCQTVYKSAPPSWVTPIITESDSILENIGESQYLLLDFQYNLVEESSFYHYRIKILNSEGIQSNSDLEISFDPTYQKLTFHQVNIIREGKTVPRLYKHPIKTLQRETSLERSLYDGSITAVMNLTDIREGDILDYSFSRKGFNPISKGSFSTKLYHEYTIPVNRVFNRITFSADQQLEYKLIKGATEPSIQKKNNLISYEWDIESFEQLDYDQNIPSWYDPQKRVEISTYETWKEVVDWAIPLYQYDAASIPAISQEITTAKDAESRILDMINWVQDDVRYLGFESGIGAYKPNSPNKVYQQRFGDCKDKSLLLVALLRHEGLEAYPLLVNTTYKQEVEHFLPSSSAFNHCVVQFSYDNNDFFIDPTISKQGGNLLNRQFPNYRKGLLLKEGQQEITTVGREKYAREEQLISEYFRMDSIGGDTYFSVKTIYFGNDADRIRSYFASNSRKDIQKDYLDYYSAIYSDLEVADELVFIDSLEESDNMVITWESYTMSDLWSLNDDSTQYQAELYPLVISSYMDYTKSAKRSMPYQLGTPQSIVQTTRVKLPEDWSITESTESISHRGFSYESSAKRIRSDSVVIRYSFVLKEDHLSSEETEAFLDKIEDASNDLYFTFTYPVSSGNQTSSTNWIAVSFAILIFCLALLGALYVYKNYNPPSLHKGEPLSIGSWLILPAIGIALAPIRMVYWIIDEGYYEQSSWENITSLSSSLSVRMDILFGFELVFNHALLAYLILLAVLFFQRRTSLPSLLTIYYAVAFAVPLLEMVYVETLGQGAIPQESKLDTYRNIALALIAAVIWIPYFNVADRVKETFTQRYQNDEND
ncbi:MAG: DUF3857 domain-containing protein [Bacteroidota bacterium]